MMKFGIPAIVVMLIAISAGQITLDDHWRLLFNGKDFTGWDKYIGPRYDSIRKEFSGAPIGLNTDPNLVFSVVKDGNEGVIRISGENFGGISTTESFKNYHLHLQFKWGTAKWHPKKDSKRDSGVLYHAVGPHGADANSWMRSQELQVQEGDCGDYWGVAGGVFDVPSVLAGDSDHRYDPRGELLTFRAGGPVGRRCIKRQDAEKPWGEWNTIDLYCFGDTSVHVINQVPVMVLYRSRQRDGDAERPLASGKIQIQSEGAEIFYRDIRISPISMIPDHILRPAE
jgi:3-keto-disaccharide hydrolase